MGGKWRRVAKGGRVALERGKHIYAISFECKRVLLLLPSFDSFQTNSGQFAVEYRQSRKSLAMSVLSSVSKGSSVSESVSYLRSGPYRENSICPLSSISARMHPTVVLL